MDRMQYSEPDLTMQNGAARMMAVMPEHRHDYKPEGLPLEEFDPFFCAPVDLEKVIATLWEDLKMLDGHAITANRFSEKYLAISRCLETLVSRAGSLFITAAAMEQQGTEIRCPKGASIGRLYDISAYHFNKAHAAVSGTQMCNPRFYIGMLLQETRWAVLLGRLHATEEKIRLIREGKAKVRAAAPDRREKNAGTANAAPADPGIAPLRNPAALPVRKDMLSGQGAFAPKVRAEDAAQTAVPADPAPVPEAEETAALFRDEEEKEDIRDFLLCDAADRADAETFDRISRADDPALAAMWNAYLAKAPPMAEEPIFEPEFSFG